MKQAEGELWQRMADAVFERDVSARPDLIRHIDSRTLLVYEPPIDRTEESPYRMKGFSIYHGTLRGKLKELKEWRDALDLDWCLMYPQPVGQEENNRDPVVYQWLEAEDDKDISASLIFAIHPQLVAYDAIRGFRFVPPHSGEGGRYRTTIPTYTTSERSAFTYQLESYPAHIQSMIRLYESELEDRLAYVAKQLEIHPDLCLPSGSLDRAIRLAIALHDVGKLQVEWQAWARNYQKAIGGEIPDYLIAHTWSETEEHRKIEKTMRPKRPHHAGEGAMASLSVFGFGLSGNARLTSAVLTAVAHHHSPGLTFKDNKGFTLHPGAKTAVGEALTKAGLSNDLVQYLMMERKTPLPDKYLLETGNWAWWLVYFSIVRAVRITDGKSQGG
jgi:CRISPR-associated endonuclease/helicase Cas3